MATNSIVLRVAQKETRLFFGSPVALLFMAVFGAVCLFHVFWVSSFFARNISDVRPLFEALPTLLVFLCAALTMRMWSDERRNGTLEHVLAQPAPLWKFVLGKFWACFFLLVLALAGTLSLPITVSLISNLDWGPVVGGYLAALLLGSAFLAIGLFVSARTDNAIVSLIGSVTLCSLLNILGTGLLTDFFGNKTGEILRLISSDARFHDITRGVLHLGDLFYYLSLVLGFLTLNAYSLEKARWAKGVKNPHHRHWRAGTILLLANLLLANIGLAQWANTVRFDLTQGKQYSISSATTELLGRLEEPLLIRGYFSERTHPLLAPLVPQLRDLLLEYELAGNGKIRIEIIDPADNPALEEEANKLYGIRPAPFQIADRHQSALVNAYFNLLVSYGDQHKTLGFSDLIEVRTTATDSPEVRLRNPEYDLTHAIKNVLFNYRSGGNLFDSIKEPVEFIGYVSNEGLLPEELVKYQAAITEHLENAASASGGKFSYRFIPPEARDGKVAQKIASEWGFKPMITSQEDEQSFYFYLTLADTRQVVQLPTETFDAKNFRLLLDSGLKRFARGMTRTVALALPNADERMAEFQMGGSTFRNLERAVVHSYTLELEDLSDGAVSPEADILAVLAPQQLDDASIYAIDQFLMRGGTVILATSPYTAELSGGQLQLRDWISGLSPWLKHHGIEIGESLVLDQQSSMFPVPVTRHNGGHEFQDVRMISYPYIIDLRPGGLASKHPVTSNLHQVSLAWTSPITFTGSKNVRLSELLTTSKNSWLSDDMEVAPHLSEQGDVALPTPDNKKSLRSYLVGAVVQGRFQSFFGEQVMAAADAESETSIRNQPPTHTPFQTPLQRSPESARIVLFASNDFLDDQILAGSVTASGTQYLGPVELFMNTLSWALQDNQLLSIRNRAHFNRTLPPTDRRVQQSLEYTNYAFYFVWLLALGLISRINTLFRRRHYLKVLAQ